MGFYGIPLNADQSKLFREFIVAWQTKLQQVKDAVISSSPFGWSEPTGKINGFAYGGRVWQKGGDKPAAAPTLCWPRNIPRKVTCSPGSTLRR
jgi:hypothetical protein